MDPVPVHYKAKVYGKVEMMISDRISSLMGRAAICLLLLTAGCTPFVKEPAETKIEREETAIVPPVEETTKPEVEPKEKVQEVVTEAPKPKEQVPEPVVETIKIEVEAKKPVPEAPAVDAVTLALKFTPQDSTTYRVTTEADRSVTWEGPQPEKPAAFKGGHTGYKAELTFAQRIQSMDDKGNAIAEITIKGLKYIAKVRDNVTLEFDSSREEDKDNALVKLIGQSYTIEISPAGQVTKVIDMSKVQAAIKGIASSHKTALASVDAIKQRHSIPAMPSTDKNQLRPGDSWSSVKTFDFQMMGFKSYEKVYKLKEIKGADDRRTAVVEMEAIPSAEMAEELHQEQTTGPFSKMFDNKETYTGKLRLDMTAGTVEECLEKLLTEWVVVDPNPEDDQEPAALKMAALRFYHMKRLDRKDSN
jgi:hypothetical protein